VVPIHIPPIRERPEDIGPMADYFLQHFWEKHRPGEARPTLLPAAQEALERYTWPGNVRELRNVLEHAVVMLDAGAAVGPESFTLGEESLAGMDGASLSLNPSIYQMDYHTAREEMLAQFEEQYLAAILKRANGNISGAARIAGVDRTTLYRLMEKRNLSKSDLLEP
jgi:DNA-binding NtrC family response regulator